ncbi:MULTISPECIES: hypothetical protein [unclassified Streptomyces]|uniref:hypothetical protein n=1 Tax=unclassified Streptomyces TaxID=2593676 RepID=UPI0004CAA2CD|nr:hypothetical protein [Streptomyces sp. NRRL F-2747]
MARSPNAKGEGLLPEALGAFPFPGQLRRGPAGLLLGVPQLVVPPQYVFPMQLDGLLGPAGPGQGHVALPGEP